MPSTIITGTFERPESGPRLRRQLNGVAVRFTKLPAWTGSGALRVQLPKVNGSIRKVWVVGAIPALGGFLVNRGDQEVAHLVWETSGDVAERTALFDDGDTEDIELVECPVENIQAAQALELSFPVGRRVTIHDVFVQYESAATCPFHAQAPGVSLDQLAAIVRVGDRVRFCKALDQLRLAIARVDHLDEAKGLGLTFLSVIVSALLEHGAPREMHSFLLAAARRLDKLESNAEVVEMVLQLAERCTANLMRTDASATGMAIDRSLRMVEREYGKHLTDEQVASTVGLSTSHFRYLFRQITGQPFHKYLLSLRLEKAKQLLVESDLSVTEIAAQCGFASPAHFSRAFSARFHATPSDHKRSRV